MQVEHARKEREQEETQTANDRSWSDQAADLAGRLTEILNNHELTGEEAVTLTEAADILHEQDISLLRYEDLFSNLFQEVDALVDAVEADSNAKDELENVLDLCKQWVSTKECERVEAKTEARRLRKVNKALLTDLRKHATRVLRSGDEVRYECGLCGEQSDWINIESPSPDAGSSMVPHDGCWLDQSM